MWPFGARPVCPSAGIGCQMRMRIIALLFALALTGCTGDRLRASTKCDEVSAVMSNPSATRDQVAVANPFQINDVVQRRQRQSSFRSCQFKWKWAETTDAL